MDAKRNLLVALTVVREKWVRADSLPQLWQAWRSGQVGDFARFLVERGVLLDNELGHLHYLVQCQLEQCHGDVTQSLAKLCPGLSADQLHLLGEEPDTFVETVGQILLPPSVPTPPAPTPPVPTAPAPAAAFERLALHAAGGIGQVWKARDRRLGREVALKELKPELAHDRELTRRFLAEAEITGQLEHPGIVPIYELPAHDGNPCYVMRFVKGQTLTDRIGAFHGLARKDRTLERAALLNIFAAVCQTVAFAHARGVLHRDLKGQNILVGDFGEVILLDWGLAKRVQKDADRPTEVVVPGPNRFDQTLPGQVLGTPYFMSPEQAAGAGGALDERADIYSLGAILYELLTGKPPFADQVERSAGSSALTLKLQDLLQLIRTGTPTRPRQLARDVPPALEAVCLKALARKPEDRYAAAADLAKEVQRWLADEPVEVFPDPWWIRLGRWSRKNKALVAALVMLGLAAMVGLVVTNILVGREKAQTELARDRAERNFRKAQDAVDRYFTQISEERLLNEPGLQPLRKELLATAKEFYLGLIKEKSDDLASRQALAQALVKLGRIAGHIGDRAESIENYRQAHDLFAALRDDKPHLDALPLGLGQASMGLGYQVFLTKGAVAEAETYLNEAVDTLEDLVRRNPAPQHRGELAHAHNSAGFFYEQTPSEPDKKKPWHERARHHRLEAVRLWRELAQEEPNNPTRWNDLGGGLLNLTVFYEYSGDKEKRDAAAREALQVRQKLADEHPRQLEYHANLAAAHNNIGIILRNDGKFAEARKHLDAAAAIREKLVRQNPSVVQYQNELANAHFNRGNLFYLSLPGRGHPRRDQHFAEGKKAYERAVALWQNLAAAYPDERRFTISLGFASASTGDLILEENKKDAVAWYSQAIALLKKQRGQGERERDLTRHLCNSYWGRAQALAALEEFVLALGDWEKALQLYSGKERRMLETGQAQTRMLYARTLALEKQYVAAARQAAAAADGPLSPQQQIHVARILCLCLEAAAKDPEAPLWADKAVLLLARAHAGGYFKSTAPAEVLPLFRSLDIIASRADFQKLAATIENAK